jgi:catechol 2,3-dioxygenase
MIDWYSLVVGGEVLFEYEMGAWISNDDAKKEMRTGLHHTAFEYASFDQLNAGYLQLKHAEIVPEFCLDHGMTFSYYYADPDGNHVELQVDNFGDWSRSRAWMRDSPEFAQDPLGRFVDRARALHCERVSECLGRRVSDWGFPVNRRCAGFRMRPAGT